MQEGEIALGQDARKGHAGADRDARSRRVDPRQRMVGRAHDGGDRDVALVQRAHHQRAAAEIARAAIGGQRRRRLAGTRKRPYRDGHRFSSALMRPPSGGGGSPRSPPDRSAPPPSGSCRPGPRAGVVNRDSQCQKVRSPSVTGQQPHMRHVVEQRDRRIEQAIAEGLLEVGQRRATARAVPSRPCSLKRRTQPILSAGWPRSIVLVATAGCQRSCPLKSRSTSQTASVGASRIVLLTMCGTLSLRKRASARRSRPGTRRRRYCRRARSRARARSRTRRSIRRRSGRRR